MNEEVIPEILSTEAKLDMITDACEERKALDLVILDVREITLIADYFVICNGSSSVHIDAIVESVVSAIKSTGDKSARVEGTSSGGWVLIDCGDILVNVFEPREREYYGLERLWGDAREKETTAPSTE